MSGLDRPKCERCGQVAETHDWERSSTFWGWFGLGTHVVTRRLVRIKSQWFRREGPGSPLLLVDEIRPLCQECWSALVEFMQGSEIAALPRKKRDA
jgi:hypothetical protein